MNTLTESYEHPLGQLQLIDTRLKDISKQYDNHQVSEEEYFQITDFLFLKRNLLLDQVKDVLATIA